MVDSSHHLNVDASDSFVDNPSRANLRWIEQTLWVGAPPSMEHLKLMQTDVNVEASKSMPVDIPDGILENTFVLGFAELFGVPVDGTISHGQLDTLGVWQIPTDHLNDLTISVPELFHESVVYLTLKITSFDNTTEKYHTQIANIYVKFPAPSDPDLDSSQLTEKTEVTSMSKIVIRFGVAPEYGDPHYRVRVEGRQVANGNLGWSMGLPALTEEGPVYFLCWHEVAVEWDFSEGIPHRISLSFDSDHTTSNERDCLLAVEWIEVNGLNIPSSSDYAKVDGARIVWPDNDQIWSWSGELVFDVTGAFTEGPAFIDLMGEQALELESKPTLIPKPKLISEPVLELAPESNLASEPEQIEELDDRHLVYIDALKLKHSFLRHIFWRATANLGLIKPQKPFSKPTRIEAEPEVIDMGVVIPTSTPIPEKHVQESVKAFYVHVLKRTLDTLEEANTPHIPSVKLNAFDITDGTPEELQNLGMHIKNQYLESILQKANVNLPI